MQALDIDHDETLEAMREFNDADSARASDAGESRQRIGEFLEETGINAKAFSHCRMVLRMKKDEKRQDWLRSMRSLLPLMEAEIAANGTRDAFDTPAEAKAAAAAPRDEEEEEEDEDIAAEADGFAAAAQDVFPAKVTTLRGRA